MSKVLKNRYKILKELGKGGFSITYQAQDLLSKKSCVVKQLSLDKASDWKAIELFERESGVLSHLDHPNIPDYIDHFTLQEGDESTLYMVQEEIQGNHFEALIEGGKFFTENEVQEMGLALLVLLKYLHQFSPPMIHRDIKPSNIMLDLKEKIFLIDFGAAKGALHDAKSQNGQPTVVGTFGYMPIEQFEGNALPASDIYSLGMTLIYILSHKHPTDMEKKGLTVNFRPHVNITESFAKILEKMIQPDLKKRYDSTQNVIDDLQELRVGPSQSSKKQRQKKKSYTGLSLALGGGLLFLGFLSLREFRAPQQVIKTESVKKVQKKIHPKEVHKSPTYLSYDEALKMGNSFYRISEYKTALPYFNRVLEIDDTAHQALFRRAYCRGKLKLHSLAIEDYKKVYRLDPKGHPNALYNIAWNYEQLKEPDLALSFYAQMEKVKPKYVDTYNNRGNLYYNQKKYDLAAKDYKKAISIKPSYHYPYNNLGEIYKSQGKYAEALVQFDLAIEKKNNYAHAHRSKGHVFYKYLKDYDKAIASFNKAILYDYDNATAYNWRGLCYYEKKNYARAREDFDKAIRYGKPYKQAVYNKGLAYDDEGMLELALETYHKALIIDPNYASPSNNIGLIYENRKEYKKALSYYDRAISSKPSALYFDNRGDVYKALKSCSKAKSDYSQACTKGRKKACKKTCP